MAAAPEQAPAQVQRPPPGQPPVVSAEQRAQFERVLKHGFSLYPQYIDATLTPEQGRRTTAVNSVPHPTLDEMFVAVRSLGATVIGDARKSLPRAQSQPYCIPPPRGVLKVMIYKPDGDGKTPINPEVPNKTTLLRKVAAFIANIPDRKVQVQNHAQLQASAVAEAGAQAIVQQANRKIKKPKRQVIRGR